MASHKITTVEQLNNYLHAAMQLEHATIPVYLTALYSLHPGTNGDAFHVIRVVAVEEMLHLTLAANVLNAVGGTPDLTVAGFIPDFPASLPDGETDFQVDRQKFSRQCVETFLKIERPSEAPDEESRVRQRDPGRKILLAGSPHQPSMQFYSIGEFYKEIERGLRYLHNEMGDSLFSGDPGRQAGPEYYYSGGGELVPVSDLHSAIAALRLIGDQGEGLGGHIQDAENELAHYYRFKQLLHGCYYQVGDEPENPTGPPLAVDWDAVYPIKTNVHLDDYPAESELRAGAEAFNAAYADFLGLLTRAYNGQPELLIEAVAGMFRLREGMTQLIRNPIPGAEGVNAGPTFEMATVAGAARA